MADKPLSPYVVLFRTHIWDEFAQKMAGHLNNRVGSGDFFILADETNGQLNVAPYRKISHTIDFSDMGLAIPLNNRDQFLWYNGDFPLYRALQFLPPYKYYCMVEFDVIFNRDFDKVISMLESNGINAVGYKLREAPEHIALYVRPYYDHTKTLLPCIFIADHDTVIYLFEQRKQNAELFRRAPVSGWPFCEGFLGSAIAANPMISYRDLTEFGTVSRYAYWPPHLYSSEMIRDVDEFLHPVLEGERYINSRIKHGADDFFDTSSQLYSDIVKFDAKQFVPLLRKFFDLRSEILNLMKLKVFVDEFFPTLSFNIEEKT